MAETVKPLRFTSTGDGRLRYYYLCSCCKREFLDSAPECSFPAICHHCYLGRCRCPKEKAEEPKPDSI